MARPCATCSHPLVREINHRIREKRPLTDISRWLDTTEQPISRLALARHAKDHLEVALQRGRRPVAGSFLEDVVATAHEGLSEGTLRVTLKDGIEAQKALNAMAAKNADRDLLQKIALALTGNTPLARVIDPEVEALEAEFRPLLTAGTDRLDAF